MSWDDLSKDELVARCKEFDSNNAYLRGSMSQAVEKLQQERADLRVYRWHATYNAALTAIIVGHGIRGIPAAQARQIAISHADLAHGELPK